MENCNFLVQKGKKMDIVINDCHGGFSLSDEAIVELYKRGSALVEVTDVKAYYGGGEGWEERLKHDESSLFAPFIYDGKVLSFIDTDVARNNKDLVEIVRNMGDSASGKFSKLAIVSIPDDVEWVVEEYDGAEWVAEAHRVWHANEED
jgi:hypothetical protein